MNIAIITNNILLQTIHCGHI